MIYLKHKYAQSGLPTPATVVLCAEPVGWLRLQIQAEFTSLFPQASLQFLELTQVENADLLVLVYVRDEDYPLAARLRWAKAHQSKARLGMAFYCLNPRLFDVIPVANIPAWHHEQRLRELLSSLRDRLIAGFD